MCGIVGYITKDPVKHGAELKRIMRRLLLASQTRGKDATGYALINNNNELDYFKDGVPATKFVDYSQFVNLKMPKIFLGHTRQGTHGSPRDNKNNHPIYSKITKMAITHNGVIWDNKGLVDKYKLKCDGEVDSEVILRMIEHEMFKGKSKSIESNVKSALKNIGGSITFALAGENFPDQLTLVRINNPLWVVYVKELDTIFYGSTKQILEAGLQKRYEMFDYFKYTKHLYRCYYQEIEDDTMITITPTQNGYDISEYEVKSKEEREYYSEGFGSRTGRWHSRETENAVYLSQDDIPEGAKWNPRTAQWELPIE